MMGQATLEPVPARGWVKWSVVVLVGVFTVLMLAGGFLVVALGAVASAAGGAPGACIGSTSSEPAVSASATEIPDTMEIPRGGGTIVLDHRQLTVADTIIGVGRQVGVDAQGIKVALMTALQESVLRMYANRSVPASLNYAHDAVGSDHDSLNPFQQRPSSGWGTVAELMDLEYSIRAFYGGPNGPNAGTPRGLLDIPGWETMTPGQAAQMVQVSAFPDAYDKWDTAADALLADLAGLAAGACVSNVTGEMALPLEPGFQMTSGYGPRNINIPGASSWHVGVDLQHWPNPCGTPVYAILPGTVTLSSPLWLSIRHPDGFVVSYLHMYKTDRLVDVNDQVTAGQQIGAVGNVPPSSGCHLDLRINITDNTNTEVAALPRSQDVGADWSDYVDPEQFTRLWGVEICPPQSCARLD